MPYLHKWKAGFTSLLSYQAVFSLSIDVTNLDDAKEDWNLYGWSPNWLIASRASTLRSPLKITCHLLCDLSPPVPLWVSLAVSYHSEAVCVCVHMHGQRVSVGSWGPLNSSFHGMRKRFCSYPASQESIVFCCMSDGNQKLQWRNLQGILYSFKCNVIIAHCRGPWTALLRFRF